MSTDLPDGNESPRGPGAGRSPRLGDARSPVGSTLSIVLAVLAVIAGYFILRELTDDDGGNAGDNGDLVTPDTSGDTTDGTTDGAGSSAASNELGGTPTSTTAPAAVKVYDGAQIAVVNVSGVSGSAAQMASALSTAGYQGLLESGNGNTDQETSIVYYVEGDAAAQAVATSIAADLGGVSVEVMPAERPASGGGVADATVLVMLGTDAAGKTLSELSGTAGAGTGTSTTVAG